MKIICVFISLIFLFSSCSFAGNATLPDSGKTLPQESKKLSAKEKIETLSDEDPRRQKIMTLTWQIQYYREQLKTTEMQYMIKCYQSKEYRNTLSKIENLNKQIRAMMLL